MAIIHIQMALWHGNVGRLANGATCMVQLGTHMREAHEIVEICQSAVAPLNIGSSHKGRAIDWYQNQRIATDFDGFLRISGVLYKF